MFSSIRNKIQIMKLKKAWRKKNPHNTTVMSSRFNIEDVEVGKSTYGAIQVINWGKGQKLSIGNYCSIAGDVMFILNGDHYTGNISTFPFKVKCLQEPYEAVSKGDIIVEDDVWIGYRATILSGVRIGQGAIVAAGAIVTKDVPPYAIVGGNPAKIIKYRFDENMRNELMKINYENLDVTMIKEHIDELYVPLKDSSQLEWLQIHNMSGK